MRLSTAAGRALTLNVTPAFPGQAVGELQAFVDTMLGGHELALNLHSIENGYMLIGPRRDGMMLLDSGTLIEETALFGDRSVPDLATLRSEAIRLPFNPVVVVDCAWRNYYHWLCLALPKAMLARRITGLSGRITIPDYRDSTPDGWYMAYGRDVWRQSLTMAELDDVIVRLPAGVYTADRVHTLWIDNPQPGLLPFLPEFDLAFEPMRLTLHVDASLPKRIVITRKADPRMTATEAETFEVVARRHGFQIVSLEGMALFDQAQLFFNAEAVIAAHGAALSNLMFGRKALRVLELNRRLDNEQHLRPWFAILAAARGQTYSFLDADQGQTTEPYLDMAAERLCSRSTISPAPWWSLP